MPDPTLQIGFVLFPRLTQLDLTGPFEVFARIPDAKVHLAWKSLDPVIADTGLGLLPTVTFETCPDLDVLCVPGGPGVNALLDDDAVLAFLRRQGAHARYVTSVCTGALVLGAAGLLEGYRAATHWASMDFLESFGAVPTRTRVCTDRNRITGGGVTAGIDFGLRLAAELRGQATAERIQLYMEYDPDPPFTAGSPDTAPAAALDAFRTGGAAMIEERRAAVARAAAKLRQPQPGTSASDR
ncbi:MAG: DJ-1/PfpI family protein [Geminicoccaceae bacterium]